MDLQFHYLACQMKCSFKKKKFMKNSFCTILLLTGYCGYEVVYSKCLLNYSFVEPEIAITIFIVLQYNDKINRCCPMSWEIVTHYRKDLQWLFSSV